MNPDISGLLRSRAGRILMSVLLGVGLSALFRRACVGMECLEFLAPPQKELEGSIFRYGNKCMRYKPRATYCGMDKVEVNMG